MDKPGDYNAVDALLDANVAKGFGDKPAFVDPARTLTYGELQVASNQVANMLCGLEIRREGRVAVLMYDTVDYPCVFWGAIRAGIVPVCINTLLKTDNYAYMLADSRVEALIISAPLLEIVRPLLKDMPLLKHIIVSGGDGSEYSDLNDLMEQASDEFETIATSGDETAFWLYSSGSTGAPKGVRHVHTSMEYVASNYGKEIIGIQHDDVCFSAAKLFFAYGLGASMAIPMSVGATTILLPERPTPEAVLNLFGIYNPTLFFGVPTLYTAMLASPDCKLENSSNRLRLCISAGEALPAEIGRCWEKTMETEIIDGIGSTEMLHVFLSNRPGEVRYGSSGREITGYKLRLADEDGHSVRDGDLGELLVSGGSAGDGYWNQRAKSRATFAGMWVHTGDKYTRDAEGYYYYCGRTDDMFKVSGRWVSPFEIEQALSVHPAVLEAAVVAQEDDQGLVKPKAYVVLNEGVCSDGLYEELKEHVKKEAGLWKYPRWVDFVDDLPKTATGKIQRFKLRA
ncbi:MAG: benzoate-CoA ligase family protein [Rhodobacteraceae bacterium]|nr:benzoate-CoA ligase family protein [Paracoccaceae bacterium]